MIQQELLIKFGAKVVSYENEETIVFESREASNYFQVKSGKIKMVNYGSEGQEYINGIFKESQSFAEPPLFGNFPYPGSAISVGKSEVFKLHRNLFFKLLESNFDLHLKFTETLSKRLLYKNMVFKEMSQHNPEQRVMTLLRYLKTMSSEVNDYKIPYTRQQIAGMMGLRVETVIRTIKKLEASGQLILKDHKVIVP